MTYPKKTKVPEHYAKCYKCALEHGWKIINSEEMKFYGPILDKKSVRVYKIKFGWQVADIVKGELCNWYSHPDKVVEPIDFPTPIKIAEERLNAKI